MEKNIKKADAIKALKELEKWAYEYPSYLSQVCDYARGYKEGILIAKQIVKDILEDHLNGKEDGERENIEEEK